MRKTLIVHFPIKVDNKKKHCVNIDDAGVVFRGSDIERQFVFNGNANRMAFVSSPYDGYILAVTTRFNVRYTTWQSIEEAKDAFNFGNIVTSVLTINDKNVYIYSEEDDELEDVTFHMVELQRVDSSNIVIEALFKNPIKGERKHHFNFSLTDYVFDSDDIDARYIFNKDFDKIAIVKTELYPKVLLITQQFKLMLTNWDTIEEAKEFIGYNDLIAYYVHVDDKPFSLVADADEDIAGIYLPIPSISHIELREEKKTVHELIIESGTRYCRQIQNLDDASFSDIQAISNKYIRNLDNDELDLLYEQLDHGSQILTSYEQLYAYMYCYGKMHEAKMSQALSQIPPSFFITNDEIEVIDYACGQAVATLCLTDYIAEEDYDICIKKTILIEPSEKALARASLHCQKVNAGNEIITINKGFRELVATDIPKTRLTRIHLFSNILDIDSYDIEHLACIVKKSSKKGDIFVCVDPWYHDRERDGRQRRLKNLLNGREIYNEVFNKYQLVQEKSWTAIITIFKI